MRVAAYAYPITAPSSVALFAAKWHDLVAEGAATGADLLLTAEYACMELAAAFPAAGDVEAELACVCAERKWLLALWSGLARQHQIWLLPGTLPWQEAGIVRNRAPLFAPDGSVQFQDKLFMTRFEAEAWGVKPGAAPGIFGALGISICYDSEFPTHVRPQVVAGAQLILVPSCTDSIHGFNRVRLSARARALENQCFVAMAPTVGLAPGLATLDENHGYAAIFGPVDRGFPNDGVIAKGALDKPGWVVADLDFTALAYVRQHGAVLNHRDWPTHQA